MYHLLIIAMLVIAIVALVIFFIFRSNEADPNEIAKLLIDNDFKLDICEEVPFNMSYAQDNDYGYTCSGDNMYTVSTKSKINYDIQDILYLSNGAEYIVIHDYGKIIAKIYKKPDSLRIGSLTSDASEVTVESANEREKIPEHLLTDTPDNFAVKEIKDKYNDIRNPRYICYYNLSQPMNELSSFPNRIIRRREIITNIPGVIYQTMQNRLTFTSFISYASSYLNLNKFLTLEYFTDKDCRQYIVSNEQYLPKKTLESYDLLVPGAFKADLFRYCIIYLNGGLYSDIKMRCVKPLRKYMDYDLIITLDRHTDNNRIGLYNAFFGAKKEHPVIYKTIKECVKRIQDRFYGVSSLDITGPLMFGDVVCEYYGIDMRDNEIRKPFKSGSYGDKGTVKVLRHNDRKIFDEKMHIIDTRVTSNVMGEYLAVASLTGKKHYSYYWDNRLVYTDSKK